MSRPATPPRPRVAFSSTQMPENLGYLRALGVHCETDGFYVAELAGDGRDIAAIGDVVFTAFAPDLRTRLAAAPDIDADLRIDVETAIATGLVAALHQNPDIDLIGIGGFGRHWTPVCDGQVMAGVCERSVAWDFTAADRAMGGQGGPFSPYFWHGLGRFMGLAQPFAALELAHHGMLTFVDPTCPAPQDPGAVLAVDTGPLMGLISGYAGRNGLSLHACADMAAHGQPDQTQIKNWLGQSHFAKMPPRKWDHDVRQIIDIAHDLGDVDGLATLTGCAAGAVAAGLNYAPFDIDHIVMCGPGRQSHSLLDMLGLLADTPLVDMDTMDLPGDGVQALAAAHLALRLVHGLPNSGPTTTGVAAAVAGGVVSQAR